jgi:hypothetical protein
LMKVEGGERFVGHTYNKSTSELERVAVRPVDSEPAVPARAVEESDVVEVNFLSPFPIPFFLIDHAPILCLQFCLSFILRYGKAFEQSYQQQLNLRTLPRGRSASDPPPSVANRCRHPPPQTPRLAPPPLPHPARKASARARAPPPSPAPRWALAPPVKAPRRPGPRRGMSGRRIRRRRGGARTQWRPWRRRSRSPGASTSN